MAVDPNHAAGRPLRPIAPAPPGPAHMYTVPIRAQSSPGTLFYPSGRPPLNFQPRPPPPAAAYQSPLPPPLIKLSSIPDLRFSGLQVAPPSLAPDTNGIIRDKARDDNQFVIQDRKAFGDHNVCCSGSCPHNLQIDRFYMVFVASATQEKKEEGDKKEDNEATDEESLEHVSPEDLLKRHVKRAKKVRARLREERLRRIARYKSRLALLLPPHAEQVRHDLAAGN